MGKSKPTMMTEYFERQEKLDSQYGPKAVVLYECGGFYEVYEKRVCACEGERCFEHDTKTNCKTCKECGYFAKKGGKASVIQNIWNVAKPAKGRWWMVGFPSDNPAAFSRHITVLVQHGWTVAVYVQSDGNQTGRLATSKEKTRTLKQMFSKGTYRDMPPSSGRAQMTMCIYIRRSKPTLNGHNDCMYEIGIASYDIDTQCVSCGEVYTTDNDRMIPFSRLRSLLCENTPSETLLICDNISVDETKELFRMCSVNLPSIDIERTVNASYRRAGVRESIFVKMFRCGQSSCVPVAQRIGVAYHEIMSIALTELLVFLEQHDSSLVNNMPIPSRLLDTEHLILHTTALYQLDVLANPAMASVKIIGPQSLMDVVNTCITKPGKELLHKRLCRPATKGTVIRDRQHIITALLPCTEDRHAIQDVLRQIRGLSNVSACLRSDRISYCQLGALVTYVDIINKLLAGTLRRVCARNTEFCKYLHKYLPECDRKVLLTFHTYIRKIFDVTLLEKATTSNIEQVSCFRVGYDTELDSIQTDMKGTLKYLRQVGESLRNVLPAVKFGCRKSTRAIEPKDMELNVLIKSDKRRYLFELSSHAQKSRCMALSTANIAGKVSAPESVQRMFETEGVSVYPDEQTRPCWKDKHTTSSYNNRVYVQFKWQEPLVANLQEQHTKLVALTKKLFGFVKEELRNKFYDSLDKLCNVMNELDVASASATNADAYGYVCPNIVDSKYATLEVTGLRHPIIERLDNATLYTPNDIIFDQVTQGYLVHGVNAAGKSSLMKSVGLAVIMAQAGLYVPATNMRLRPYKHLFTRITKGDDLFNGLSSFQVEMLELGSILRRSTNDSLVIGDEICSGTETTSAVAIVGASVLELVETGTHFLFATHLHELGCLDEVSNETRVKNVHMHVEVDDEGNMTYTRKLVNGTGPDTYGIEACTGVISLPKRFLRNARRFRHTMSQHPDSRNKSALTSSNYNKTLLSGPGNTCTYPGCKCPAVDVHHIIHQSVAKDCGYIKDGRHKNAKSNLMLLCKEHHRLMHSKDSPNIVAKWIATNNGPRMNVITTAK